MSGSAATPVEELLLVLLRGMYNSFFPLLHTSDLHRR
jgi:hypothetical protein